MANAGKIHVGDLGTEIQIAIQDTNTAGNNVVTDLSTSTALQITVIDPNGNVVLDHVAATKINPPGSDGLIHIITSNVTSIWTISGMWKWYATYTIAAGTFSTNAAIREILAPGA